MRLAKQPKTNMCGIVGYIGNRSAYPIIIQGLKRLEYRGYDSAGIALLNSELQLTKTKGKVADLEAKAQQNNRSGTLGIGHTRWATHGVPNDVNAHPHTSNSGRLVLVHNGIIENYESLRACLFLSESGSYSLSCYVGFMRYFKTHTSRHYPPG